MEIDLKTYVTGNSLVVQGSELSTFAARAQVQSLVRRLTSHKPHDFKKIFFNFFNFKKLKMIYVTEIVKKKKKRKENLLEKISISICLRTNRGKKHQLPEE